MALERGGIELIVKGFSQFINSMGQVNKSYQQMGKAADGYAKSTQKASNTVLSAQRRLEASQRNLQKALIADSVAWRKAKMAREDLAKANKRVEAAEKALADATEDHEIFEALLTEAIAARTRATDKSVIANKEYQSTLLSMQNAKTRVASAIQSVIQAHLAENAAMTQGIGIATTAGVAMKVLGVAVAALGIALGAAALAWKGFNKVIDIAISLLNKAWGVVKNVAASIGRFISNVLSTAAGFGLYDIFRNISSAVSETVSEVIDAIGYFQRLEIQLEALSARDIAQEFGIPMADAFHRAGLRAKELDTWIKNIAVRTPFTAQGIAETLAMANAMGLNINMAKDLTGAVIDFTSAMGLTEDHMFRIIYNFGQMLAQGKLNGREFRDLANSFVPVWRMLENMADQAGMTAEELKKLAFEGGVPVEAFFNEFIRMAEEDFAGAASKMARTLTGVANNFKDFIQIIVGTSILGPVMDRIAEKLATMLDAMLKPEVRAKAERLGQVLLTSFQMVERAVNRFVEALGGLARALGIPIPAGNTLYNMFAGLGVVIRRALDYATGFVKELTTRFSGAFEGLGGKMASWGYNLVASFASGMAAAVNLIVKVINAIVSLLNSWFAPGSPPKIAKNIDKWGAEMIGEWVKGWTNFDISAFSDIANTVESFLRSIAYKIGGKDNVDLIPRILGSRKVIADAINAVRNGLISVGDAAERVYKQVGYLTKEFKDYIAALFDVTAAEKKVADAAKAVEESQKKVADAQVYVDNANKRIEKSQDELAEVTEHYEGILKRLNDQLRAVTEEYDEQRRLNQINSAISTGLLTDAEKERLAMERRSIQIKQQIRNVEDERDAAKSAIEDRIRAYELERDAAQARVDALEDVVEQLEKAEEAAQAELDAAQERLDLYKSIIDEQIKQNDLVQEQINLLKQLEDALKGGGGGGGIEDMFEGLGGAAGAADSKVKDLSESIRKFRLSDKRWITNPPSLPQIFRDMEDAIDKVSAAFANLELALAPLIGEGGALTNLNTALGKLPGAFEGITEKGSLIWGFIVVTGALFDSLAESANTLAGSFDRIDQAIAGLTGGGGKGGKGGGIIGLLSLPFAVIAGHMNGLAVALDGVSFAISNIVEGMDKFFEIFSIEDGKLVINLSKLPTVIEGIMQAVLWAFLLPFVFLGGYIWGWVEGVIGFFQNLWDRLVGNSIIPEMMQDIYDAITTKFDEISTWISETWIVQMLASMLGWALLLVGPGGIIPTAMQDIWNAITTKMDEVKTEWDTRWTAIKTALSDMWNAGGGIIEILDLAMAAAAAFFGLDGTLATAIKGFINNIITWATTEIGNLATALSDLKLAWQEFKNTTGLQSGGIALQGNKYIVGEAGREMFIPAETGIVLPNWLTERILAPPMASGATSNTYITNVEVNPTYKNIQSEASVYYDVTAALAAARR